MIFWITALAITLTVAALFVLTLLKTKATAEHPAEYDLRVYRDQLSEVERDLARGTINEADAERIRTEVGRRVLAADAQLRQSGAGNAQPHSKTRKLAYGVVACVLAGTVLLYVGATGVMRTLGYTPAEIAAAKAATTYEFSLPGGSDLTVTLAFDGLGSPGKRDLSQRARIAASDQMRAERLSQADYEAQMQKDQGNRQSPQPDPQYAALMDKLRKTVAERPDDLQGQTLLARNEASLGNFAASYTAQQQVIRIKGDAATATDYSTLAEMMIRATRGYVSPEAETALREALSRDPRYPPARYFTALMFAQNDRPDVAFRMMDGLLRDSRPDAPWVPAIRSQIEELAWRAGVRYQLPEERAPATDAPGPSAADIANAANLTPSQRQEMVRGMVQTLSDRLASQGGSPEEWSRLISSLSVIGEQERATAIWAEAQSVFADKPDALAIVRGGAARAGLVASSGQPPAPALPGPSAEDVKNAAEMTPEERKAMIEGMVATLSDRLTREGGTAQEWARLITSQATLGNKQAAQQALDLAQKAHADDPAAMDVLLDAAKTAGLFE